MDLAAQFQKLVQMISIDMKKVGARIDEATSHIQQIVAKVNELNQRLVKLEQTGVQQQPGQPVPPQVVNGEVVQDATPLFKGNPNAFFEGDDGA
jgi:DNA anti-recombination protein RmuC